jgi:hypothetical protein
MAGQGSPQVTPRKTRRREPRNEHSACSLTLLGDQPGEDYRPHEVQAMMELLWAEYVDANPRLFEVYD